MPLPAPARTEALPAGARRALAFVIVVAHLGVWWALATSRPASPMASAGAPLEVMLISAPLSRPSIVALPHPPSLALPAAPRIAEPAITFAAETTQAATRSEPAEVGSAAASPPIVVEAPPAPRAVPPSALRYVLPPSPDYPAASRRLGESGTVLLRVVVDTQGRPKRIALQRSSGFARLDEQALAAMRQARFAPCTEHGMPIECESSAALAYDLEN